MIIVVFVTLFAVFIGFIYSILTIHDWWEQRETHGLCDVVVDQGKWIKDRVNEVRTELGKLKLKCHYRI